MTQSVKSKTRILFENARVFDGVQLAGENSLSVLVEGREIKEVSAHVLEIEGTERIDCRGKTLMPGLIDNQMSGKLGVVKPGALADRLLVDGDPLGNIELLAASGRHLTHIMVDGRFTKRPGQ